MSRHGAAIAVVVAAFWLAHGAQAQALPDPPDTQLSAPSLEEPLARPPAVTTNDDALRAALRLTTERFDTLLFIEAARSIMSGVFELYCAIGMYIPDRVGEGPDGADIAIGTACLVGVIGNFVLGALRIAAANDDSEERDRMHRFDEAAADGLDERELDVFEAELEDGASNARLRRGLSIAMGTGLVIAAGLLLGFTAAGEVNEVTGITIGTALSLAGLLSFGSLFVETPYEAAANAFRAAR